MRSSFVGQLRTLSCCLIPFLTICASALADQTPYTSATNDALEEVVVTAQKRAENVQKVPISISVLGGRDLDESSFAGVTDALNNVPGVAATVGFQGGTTQISVRGVSAASPLFNSSSPIGYYLDSIPFGLVRSAIAPDANAYGAGVDFSVTARPVDNWQVALNVGWNGLSVDSDVISQGALLFHKGDRLNYSPEYTVGASTQYVIAFGGSGFKGRLAASSNYTSVQDSRAITGAANMLYVFAGNSILIDRASFTVDAPDNWSAMLYADNINNAHGAVLGNQVPEWALRVRPRTIGMQIDFHLR